MDWSGTCVQKGAKRVQKGVRLNKGDYVDNDWGSFLRLGALSLSTFLGVEIAIQLLQTTRHFLL
jgi:hypothetical protein